MTSLNLLRAELIQHLAVVERKIEEVLEDETDARFSGTPGRAISYLCLRPKHGEFKPT